MRCSSSSTHQPHACCHIHHDATIHYPTPTPQSTIMSTDSILGLSHQLPTRIVLTLDGYNDEYGESYHSWHHHWSGYPNGYWDIHLHGVARVIGLTVRINGSI